MFVALGAVLLLTASPARGATFSVNSTAALSPTPTASLSPDQIRASVRAGQLTLDDLGPGWQASYHQDEDGAGAFAADRVFAMPNRRIDVRIVAWLDGFPASDDNIRQILRGFLGLQGLQISYLTGPSRPEAPNGVEGPAVGQSGVWARALSVSPPGDEADVVVVAFRAGGAFARVALYAPFHSDPSDPSEYIKDLDEMVAELAPYAQIVADRLTTNPPIPAAGR
jgi:hypothetical protein